MTPKFNQRLAHKNEGGEQSLRAHLLGVASLARSHAGKLDLPLAGTLLGLLHDLGKSSDVFQEYLCSFHADGAVEPQDELRGKIDHSTAGAQCIVRNLPRGEMDGSLEGILARLLALCIASHHSGLIDCLYLEGGDSLNDRLGKEDTKTRYTEAWRTVDAEVRAQAEAILQSSDLLVELQAKVAAVLRHTSKGPERDVQLGLLVRLLFSCLIDADRTDTADFERPHSATWRQGGQYESWEMLAERLEMGLAGLTSRGAAEINAVRRAISDQCLAAASRPGGVYTLTVPTGGGKTLAALRFALAHAQQRGLERVIFVSPYISIVDQNAAVAREILEPEGAFYGSVVLEHHSNLASEDGKREHWRRKILAENWDAPVVFTTMAQVLESLFGGGTRAVRRMHAMAKAVLVFDEVQTLPVRLVHLFNNALNLLAADCSSTVVLCTATQPLLNKVDAGRGAVKLASTPELIEDVAGTFRQLRRYTVFDETDRHGDWSLADAAELVCTEARNHSSCLAIVNTRRDAREIFELCRERLPVEAHVAHLSTGMCPAHRTHVLSTLKDRLMQAEGAPVVCVSTQLIEAGVDIDFAVVVRDLAGLDSLAQAAGRCNRNGQQLAPGRVHIIKLPPLPKALDEIRKGQEVALELLGKWRRDCPGEPFPLDDPEQMRVFYEKAFYRRAEEMSYALDAKKDKLPRSTTMLELLGANRVAQNETERVGTRLQRTLLLQSFKTANDAFAVIGATQGIAVPYGPHGSAAISNLCASLDLAAEWQLLRAAQPYTISVYPSLLARLEKAGAIYQAGAGVWCLRAEHYDDNYGLRLAARPLEEMFA